MKPKSETQIMPDLVAYLDGELSERDHGRVAATVGNSSHLQREAVRFERVGSLVAELARVAPSSDFADTFWRRLEREGQIEHESQFARWHRKWSEGPAWFIAGEGWKEWLSGGPWTPSVVPVASLCLILAALFSGMSSLSPPGQRTQSEQLLVQEPPRRPTWLEQIPPQVMENATFFRDYWLAARLKCWTHFDEIMRTQVPRRPSTLTQEQVPPTLIENPNFFMHYQILRRMDQFQYFESVQSVSFDQADQG